MLSLLVDVAGDESLVAFVCRSCGQRNQIFGYVLLARAEASGIPRTVTLQCSGDEHKVVASGGLIDDFTGRRTPNATRH